MFKVFKRKRRAERPSESLPRKDVFTGLRDQLVSGHPEELGIAASKRFPRVWAVFFEQGMGSEVATVVSLADGTTSLYTSIGGGAHPQVVEATYRFLDAVEASFELLTRSDVLPLPEPEEVRFNVLTYDGPRTASARRADLGDHQHPLRPLFIAGHAVIAQLRLLPEAGEPSEGGR